jgi:hypothetical protein
MGRDGWILDTHSSVGWDGEDNESLSDAAWIKSTASMANGACVEVAYLPDYVAVRDSKNKTGPVLRFKRREWQELLDAIRENRHRAS